MQKDYFEVSSKNSETKFVEDYWTKKWEEDGLTPDLKKEIEKSEEYIYVKKYILNLKKGSLVLDGGSGKGEWTLYLTYNKFRCIGLDISRKTILKLKEVYPNVLFQQGDIRKMKFNNNYFDAYFSWGTFEHFEQGLGLCFSEANRVLKKNSPLIITVPYQNYRQVLDNYKNKIVKLGKIYQFYQWRLNKQEIKAEFEMNGFDVLEIVPVGKSEGLKRMIRHSFCLDPEKGIGNFLLKVLDFTNIIPKNWCYHMLLVVGVKR